MGKTAVGLPEGVCQQSRILQLVRRFIDFEDEGGGRLTEKPAGYHQFHAVNRALAATLNPLAGEP